MAALDGTFDEVCEAVRVKLTDLTKAGSFNLCVRAIAGILRGTAGCAKLVVKEKFRYS
ncbi:hypothetical protein GCM10008955_33180 [Deinococcus malanensis]|uniref:Uncharacterized protein n=1 Tax=Deinococcus malanensis TaxID=1706855 RepID=A0ABQ2F3B9_9DEIO|nr:hypothetical protein GCM10008955_33180 [Deinococcus malanensis]